MDMDTKSMDEYGFHDGQKLNDWMIHDLRNEMPDYEPSGDQSSQLTSLNPTWEKQQPQSIGSLSTEDTQAPFFAGG